MPWVSLHYIFLTVNSEAPETKQFYFDCYVLFFRKVLVHVICFSKGQFINLNDCSWSEYLQQRHHQTKMTEKLNCTRSLSANEEKAFFIAWKIYSVACATEWPLNWHVKSNGINCRRSSKVVWIEIPIHQKGKSDSVVLDWRKYVRLLWLI